MRAATIALGVLVAGCSGAETASSTPTPSVDSAAWACLGTPIAIADRRPAPVTYAVHVADFNGYISLPSPIDGLKISVCGSFDCSSSDPGVETIASPSGSPTLQTLTLPSGFTGWLVATATGFLDAHYSFGGPMVGTPEGDSIVQGLTISMMKRSDVQRAHDEIGIAPFDPSRGVLLTRALDCQRPTQAGRAMGSPAAGVGLVAVSDGAAEYAIDVNNIVRSHASSSARGDIGLFNVPPGDVTVSAVAPSGATYVTTTLPVAPNSITIAELRLGLGAWGQ